MRRMRNSLLAHRAVRALLLLAVLGCAGCATTGGAIGESEPVVVAEEPESRDEPVDALEREPEVPLAVAESEQHEAPPAASTLAEVVVAGRRSERQDEIHDRVIEAQSLLRNVKLDYVFTGRGRGNGCAGARWLLHCGARCARNGP